MYSNADKLQAFKLRLEGNSYNEICRCLGIRSKGTLSSWFKELVLTPEAEERLKGNLELATRRKLLAFNEERSRRIRNENEAARESGAADVGSLSKRELLLVGAALYWGEGTKSEGSSSYNSLSFANSDPRMIQLFLRFLREVLEVPDEKIRCAIHMYDPSQETLTKEVWAACTRLPLTHFTVSYQVSGAGKGVRKTLPYGTLSVRVHNRHLFYRVKGMIQGLATTLKSPSNKSPVPES